MKGPASSQASRELESITLSILKVRILLRAAEQPGTVAAIAGRLRQHGGPTRRTTPAQLLAGMARNGLLKPSTPSRRGSPEARKYAITPKGRQTLNAARKLLLQLAAE